MVAIFSAACVYMALRAGNAIEAAIPIAILAIFFGRLKAKKSTILENVMVQSIGQASGVVAAGSTFVIPALYINRLDAAWWQIFLACAVGGVLGTVLIIPLRKYFVKDLHGELPFPEATAINEILVTGESTAGGAGKILLLSFGLGMVFDFLVEGTHLWNAGISTTDLLGGVGAQMSGVGLELQVIGLAALFGLGYIIGIKYASIIASGSVLAVLVMVPLVKLFGSQAGAFSYAGATYDIAAMGPGKIFGSFIKPIGIGAIAISGLIGILRMSKIVVGSITLGFKGLKRGASAEPTPERTQLDMAPKTVLLIQFASMLAMGALFFVVATVTPGEGGASYTVGEAVLFAVVGMVVGFLLSFLFTPVAAQAIAIVGVNPVSGMTLITVVLSIGAMIVAGLKGTAGMIIALIVGTAVCTALSTSGALISDFKIGYWIGSTPRQQQRWKFLGIVLAALVVALVIPLMDQAYHFVVQDAATGQYVSNDKVLPAPQANMLAAVSKGLMSDPANQPWLLYGLGGMVAILLFMAGVPMLAFALGMYLPLAINMAVLAGAAVAWLISRTGGSPKVRSVRAEQGTLIASGLMAGAAIVGIVTAVLRLPAVGAPIRFISVGEQFEFHAVVEGKDKYDAFTCEDLLLSAGQSCEVRDVGVPDKGTVTAVFVDGERIPDVPPCGMLRVDPGQACAMREVEAGKDPVAHVDCVPVAPVTSCDRLALPPESRCEAVEVPAETRKVVFVDGRQHPPMTSCGQLRIPDGATCDETLVGSAAHWYEGRTGQWIGLIMLGVLGFLCYLLARVGARWAIAAEPPEPPAGGAGVEEEKDEASGSKREAEAPAESGGGSGPLPLPQP
jgi:putative OPT family oligopeptide transporter